MSYNSHEKPADEDGVKERKRRRVDMVKLVSFKDAVNITNQHINSEACGDIAKCVLNKMLGTKLIDDTTNPLVIQCIVEHANDLFRFCHQLRDGNGFDLIKGCINPDKYSAILSTYKSNYSALHDVEDKCVFWTLSSAFFIMYYEINSSLVFDIPFKYQEQEFEIFLRRYPEFLVRTWDATSLLEFQLCMKWAVRCFGNGNNMGCLVELVTRIMKGRQVALTCNTSGGGLKHYDQATEVSTEKCRILIYQRESGIVPRTRKNRCSKKKFIDSGPHMMSPGGAMAASGYDMFRMMPPVAPGGAMFYLPHEFMQINPSDGYFSPHGGMYHLHPSFGAYGNMYPSAAPQQIYPPAYGLDSMPPLSDRPPDSGYLAPPPWVPPDMSYSMIRQRDPYFNPMMAPSGGIVPFIPPTTQTAAGSNHLSNDHRAQLWTPNLPQPPQDMYELSDEHR